MRSLGVINSTRCNGISTIIRNNCCNSLLISRIIGVIYTLNFHGWQFGRACCGGGILQAADTIEVLLKRIVNMHKRSAIIFNIIVSSCGCPKISVTGGVFNSGKACGIIVAWVVAGSTCCRSVVPTYCGCQCFGIIVIIAITKVFGFTFNVGSKHIKLLVAGYMPANRTNATHTAWVSGRRGCAIHNG